MNYKSEGISQDLPLVEENIGSNEFSQNNISLSKDSQTIPNADKKYSKLRKYIFQLDSVDDKKNTLGKIQTELLYLQKKKYDFLPAFSQGQILVKFLEIFQFANLSYTKAVLSIFHILLNNSHEFASFIKLHEDDFFQLVTCPPLFCDLIDLFAVVVMAIPDFAFDLHSNQIINLLFSVCNDLQSDSTIPNSIIIEQLVSISSIIEVLIQKNVLYDTSSSDPNTQEQLIHICHCLLTSDDLIKVKSNKNHTHNFTKCPKIKTEEEETNKCLTKIHTYALNMINYLLLDTNLPIYLLFDDCIQDLLFKWFTKGIFIPDISKIFIRFVKNYPQDAFAILSNNHYMFLLPFFRHGKSVEYQWIIIDVIIAFVQSSQEIAFVVNEQNYFEHFESQLDSLCRDKKEIVYTLFCHMAIQIPQEMATHEALELYLTECINLCTSSSTEFQLAFFSMILRFLECKNERFYSIIGDFLEELEETSTEIDDDRIIDITKRIMEQYQAQ